MQLPLHTIISDMVLHISRSPVSSERTGTLMCIGFYSSAPFTIPNIDLRPWDSPGKNTGVGLECSSPGDLSGPGIKPHLMSLILSTGFFTTSATWAAPPHSLFSPPQHLWPLERLNEVSQERCCSSKSCSRFTLQDL